MAPSPLHATVAQTNPTLGDLHRNLADHVEVATAARDAGAELLLFPELSLTGYFLRDQVPEVALRPDDALFDPLRDLSRAVTLAVGFAERAADGRCFNTLGVLEDGAWIALHRKVHLVSYGMFDESRDFAPGERWTRVRSRTGHFGLFLCEDAWHLGGQLASVAARVDGLLVASAGPGRGVGPRATTPDVPEPATPESTPNEFASVRTWRRILSAAAIHAQAWVLWANRVGFEDGVAFSGASSAYGPDGELLAGLPGLDEGLLSVALDPELLFRARQTTPLGRDPRLSVTRRALDELEQAPDREA